MSLIKSVAINLICKFAKFKVIIAWEFECGAGNTENCNGTIIIVFIIFHGSKKLHPFIDLIKIFLGINSFILNTTLVNKALLLIIREANYIKIYSR